jgi:hypothetical protein
MEKPDNTDHLKQGIPFKVTADGSLGLLALGAVGIKAWRKKREEEKAKIKENKKG